MEVSGVGGKQKKSKKHLQIPCWGRTRAHKGGRGGAERSPIHAATRSLVIGIASVSCCDVGGCFLWFFFSAFCSLGGSFNAVLGGRLGDRCGVMRLVLTSTRTIHREKERERAERNAYTSRHRAKWKTTQQGRSVIPPRKKGQYSVKCSTQTQLEVRAWGGVGGLEVRLQRDRSREGRCCL